HRHELCREHAIPFGVTYLDLPDREACKCWIVANQLARRNISSQAASYLRGTRYLLEKGNHGGSRANGEKTSHDATLETSRRLADEFHVDRATIFRDATFAAALDTIAAACGQEAKEIILARDSGITRRVVLVLAKITTDELPRAVAELIETGKLPRRAGSGKKSTITLPTEPKGFAAKLVARLGVGASSQIIKEVRKIIRATPVNGAACGATNRAGARRGRGKTGDVETENTQTTRESFNPARARGEAGLATAPSPTTNN
ncbi:MAG TPA: hypothetical protein VGX78_21840, partial [Pirellulales bacterium]|nr:hypothetical protein [Pirellulales bacterium]